MPRPKVSGIINNCALDSAIPSIARFVEMAANLEKSGQLSDISGIPAYVQYEQLKNIFAAYHNIPVELFNWQAFDKSIKSTPNFLEQQIIFSPVIRQFVAAQMSVQGKNGEEIAHLTTIQGNGRYATLHAKEATDFFYKPLGIETTFHYQEAEIPDETFPVENWLDQIDLYHNDGHFELSNENHAIPNPNIDRLSPVFATAFTNFNSVENTYTQLEAVRVEASRRILSAIQPVEANTEELSQHQTHVIEKLVESQTHHSSTQSNQQYKAQYRENLTQLMTKYNLGFFNNVDDKIDTNDIDNAAAKENEEDDEFAKRLQEAELRGAKLKP